MEAVKASVPRQLVHEIENSVVATLDSTCSSLLCHFSSNDTCSQLLKQLTDPTMTSCAKDAETTVECKREGNAAFRSASFWQALGCYIKALRYASMSTGSDLSIVGVLLVNRAATLHALGLLDAAARDCSRAIELQPTYAKAWYRRGRVGADLRQYEKARQDFKKALSLENSTGARRQVTVEMVKLEEVFSTMALGEEETHTPSLQPGSRSWKPGELDSDGVVVSYWTSEKQWGLQTVNKLDAGSLVLEEEPYGAVVLKRYRNTHCHFCFEQLPADPIPCTSCAIPLYCDEICRRAACRHSGQKLEGQRISCSEEHRHECGGASWSAVLPPDSVLAMRMLVGSLGNDCMDMQLDALCHHYEDLSGADKVELHVLAVVVALCYSCSSVFPHGVYATASVAAKLVRLISQVRANAMAVVKVYSPDYPPPITTNSVEPGSGSSASLLSSIEQVKVAQAVYATGSKLNHSCDPNVHASFRNRCLSVRSVKAVPAGAPLELCYGPQIGEMRRAERRTWLRQHYLFICRCSACTTSSPSDQLLFAMRCSTAGCDGVVLDPDSVGPGVDFSNKERVAVEISSNRVCWNPSSQGLDHAWGQCLKCGAKIDIMQVANAAKASLKELQRVESKLHHASTNKELESLLPAAMKALGNSKGIFHASCKELAKAEDLVAQLLCALNRAGDALPYCETAIKILEQIYNRDHIAMANELLKMTSVALAASDVKKAQQSFSRVNRIMTIHYGSQFWDMFPFVGCLQKALDQAGCKVFGMELDYLILVQWIEVFGIAEECRLLSSRMFLSPLVVEGREGVGDDDFKFG